MAVSVNDVYRTVLLILNKEQRGYMTPEEFNKIGTQVQKEIFDKYFEDLNQVIRTPQTDMDYASRIANLDEKMQLFKRDANATFAVGPPAKFTLPSDVYFIGSVTYEEDNKLPIEMQKVNRFDFYNLRKSPLVTPTESFPIYLFENDQLQVYPESINTKAAAATANVGLQYIKTPSDVVWGYTIGGLGQFIYAAGTSVNFELHISEFTELVLSILMYAGIVIRDPQIVQAAAGQLQADRVNAKS